MRKSTRIKHNVEVLRVVVETMERRVLLSTSTAGQLDPTFGTGGELVTPSGQSANFTAVAAQFNGGLVVSRNNLLTRLTPGGHIDTSFGTNGQIALADSPLAIFLNPTSGMILTVGSNDMESINFNGMMDSNFNGGKPLPIPAPVTAATRNTKTGEVYLVTGVDIRAYKYDKVDTSFGVNGIVQLGGNPLFSLAFEGGEGIAIDSQGNLDVSLGIFDSSGQLFGVGQGPFGFAVERLRPSGKVDTTFGNNGYTTPQGAGGDDANSSAIAVAPDGTIYQALNDDQGTSNNFGGIVGYSANGVTQGTINESNIGNYGAVLNMVVQPDGKLLATGYVDTRTIQGLNLFAARYEPISTTSLGGSDLSFNGTGVTRINYTNSPENQNDGNIGLSINLTPNGNILVAGVTNDSQDTPTLYEFTLTALTSGYVGTTSAQLTGTVIGTTGSYRNHGTVGANAFDGKQATFFDAPTASGSWTGLDFGSPKVVTQIDYYPRQGYESRMVGGVFQASNNSSFTSGVVNLYTITTVPTDFDLTSAAVSNSGSYRYVRYLGPSHSYCNIAEAQFFGIPSTNPAQLGGVTIGTAGSYRGQGNTAAKAFDGNVNTFFDAPNDTGSYAGLDLGTAKIITQIRYAPRSGWAFRMVGGIFQGSNSADFSSGNVTLYTVTTIPEVGVLTTVPVLDGSAYRYVRYLGPTKSYCNIAEAQFFGITPAA